MTSPARALPALGRKRFTLGSRVCMHVCVFRRDNSTRSLLASLVVFLAALDSLLGRAGPLLNRSWPLWNARENLLECSCRFLALVQGIPFTGQFRPLPAVQGIPCTWRIRGGKTCILCRLIPECHEWILRCKERITRTDIEGTNGNLCALILDGQECTQGCQE